MFHRRLLKEFKENRSLTAGMVISLWGIMLANVVLVWNIASLLERVLAGGDDTQGVRQMALQLPVILVLVILVRTILTFWNQRLSTAASGNVKRKLREIVYKKLMELGKGYHSCISTAEAVQISTEGVEQLEIYFAKYVPQFFYSLLAPVTLFFLVGTMSLKVAAVLLVCVPLIPVSIVAVQKFAKKLLSKYWGTYTELGDTFLEGLQGLTTLKIYQADERYARKMDEEAERFRQITMKVLVMQLNSISVMDLVAYGGTAIGIVLAVLEYRSGNLGFAQCLFILLICAEFFLPLRLLGSFFHIAMNGNAAADKIFALIDSPVPEKGNAMEGRSSELEFRNVTFSYSFDSEPEHQVLRGVSFHVPENSFTALAGVSGCGKSTVASLICGDLSGFEGDISIGGIPAAQWNQDGLNRKVTRVRHDSWLFQGTVAENLRMGRPEATDGELEDALKKVDLYDTIQEKGGLSMILEEKAANLSGGQKQRLALARALLHNSDIYIFDEATSNIDVESENRIMEVIREMAGRKTILMISHRLANAVGAGQILVMKDGCIVEQGSHEGLIGSKGYYAELYHNQRELEKYVRHTSRHCLL